MIRKLETLISKLKRAFEPIQKFFKGSIKQSWRKGRFLRKAIKKIQFSLVKSIRCASWNVISVENLGLVYLRWILAQEYYKDISIYTVTSITEINEYAVFLLLAVYVNLSGRVWDKAGFIFRQLFQKIILQFRKRSKLQQFDRTLKIVNGLN